MAAPFVDADKQVADAAAALDGARAILVERFAEDADLIGALREQMWSNGLMTSTVRKGKKTEGEKFKDYFDFSEPLTSCRRIGFWRCSAAKRKRSSICRCCRSRPARRRPRRQFV